MARRMTPMFRLYADLLDPDKAVCANDSSARCRRMGKYFVMTNSRHGGVHQLLIDETSPDRLWQHWQGFKQATREQEQPKTTTTTTPAGV